MKKPQLILKQSFIKNDHSLWGDFYPSLCKGCLLPHHLIAVYEEQDNYTISFIAESNPANFKPKFTILIYEESPL